MWKDTLLSIELRCAQVITPQSLTTLLKSAALKKFIMERVYKKKPLVVKRTFIAKFVIDCKFYNNGRFLLAKNILAQFTAKYII